jgi:hypothetical protein
MPLASLIFTAMGSRSTRSKKYYREREKIARDEKVPVWQWAKPWPGDTCGSSMFLTLNLIMSL